jgi:hypothetical protein
MPQSFNVIRTIALPQITIFVIFLALNTQAQNILDKTGLGAGATASAAYSSRLLSSSYAGSALQVRRSSDNSTQDIGFTANGDLDTAMLKTFVGAGDAFISAWYDQSGNGKDLTQAAQANQPQLLSGGTIYRENDQPFIRFFGTGGADYRSLNLAADMTTVGHVSAVLRFSSTGDGFILSHTADYYWHSEPYTALINSTYASASVQGGNGWENGNAYAPTSMPWPSTLTIAELEPSTPSTNVHWNNIGSDRNQYHHISQGGGYGELILFSTALSTADRQTLEANEQNYFTALPLPVTWLSFTAQASTDDVHLQWQTASEQNSKNFQVQYSADGSSWTILATVPAAGNSSSVCSYHYIRYDAPAGENYYRIAETDLDGKTTYSDIRTVRIDPAEAEFKVIQNPVIGGLLHVNVNRPTILSLFSVDGDLLWRKHYDRGTAEIPMNGDGPGEYILAGKTLSVKVLVK